IDRPQAQEPDGGATDRERVDAGHEGEPDLGTDRGHVRVSDGVPEAETETEEGHRAGRRRRGGTRARPRFGGDGYLLLQTLESLRPCRLPLLRIEAPLRTSWR